jgi:hypothetical protein
MRAFLSLLLCTALLILNTLPALAQTNPLVIGLAPDGKQTDPIPLNIVGDATTASTQLYVSQNSDSGAELANVRLSAQLLDDNGHPPSGASLTLTAHVPVSGTAAINDVDATLNGFTVPPAGHPVRVSLNIANLNVVGTFTGTIVSDVGGSLASGPKLVVKRFPTPKLQVAGLSNTLTESAPDLRAQFRIESTNRAATKLRVSVDPFVGPDGAPVEPQWSVNGNPPDAQVDVAGLGSVTVSISATLPLTGNYASSMAMIYADQRESTQIAVTRAYTTPTIEVLGVERAYGTTNFGQGNADVWLTLHETAGQTVTLQIPTLSALILTGPNQAKFQGQFNATKVMTETQEVKSPFTLGPGATQFLRMEVDGLQSSGQYDGVLLVSGSDTRAIATSVTILMKDSAVVAAFLIFIGVLASVLIRRIAKNIQPRLVWQRKVLVLLQDIDDVKSELGDLPSGEQDLLDVLGVWQDRLRSLYQKIDSGDTTTADAELTDIGTKLPLFRGWVNLRLQVDALRPPELQTQFRQPLKAIGKQLRETSTPDDLKKIGPAIDDLKTKIQGAVSDTLTGQIKDFKAEVARQKTALTSDPRRNELQTTVEAPLTDAENHVGAKEWDEARASFDKARQAYASFLIQDLSDQLNHFDAAHLPLGFKDDAEWSELKNSVNEKLTASRQALAADPDAAIKFYQEARAIYLKGLADKFKDQVEKNIRTVNASGDIPLDQKPNLVAQLQSVGTLLDSALGKLNTEPKQLGDAAQDYQKASESYNALISELHRQNVMDSAKVGTLAAVSLRSIPGAAPSQEAAKQVSTRRARRLPTLVEVNRQLQTYEWVMSGAVLLVAVILGLKLLWADDATWGGWTSYLAALLWGLGLHQVAGAAFQGVTQLGQQISNL